MYDLVFTFWIFVVVLCFFLDLGLMVQGLWFRVQGFLGVWFMFWTQGLWFKIDPAHSSLPKVSTIGDQLQNLIPLTNNPSISQDLAGEDCTWSAA